MTDYSPATRAFIVERLLQLPPHEARTILQNDHLPDDLRDRVRAICSQYGADENDVEEEALCWLVSEEMMG